MALDVLDGGGLPTQLDTDESGGVHTPRNIVTALPGTVEADIAASKGYLLQLIGTITSGRIAVDLTTAVVNNIASMTAKLQSILDAQAPAAAIYDGSKNVTTAGTRVVLANSQALTKGVRVRAKDANAGLIYIGGATVSSSSDRLAPGEATWIDANNLALVWIDAAVSGEGVTFCGW